ncbi:hypothetical protein L210DRAFT_2394516 [Boletus edulis BED1]|uniref:DH domain-containing protein n=1 Tax=Boletus edulis BED1 TaxID=1328754 RepID=A0AAD4C6N4_BOLED|nr:hypothetical protein L210DRAFT_2394516 [Boletus edulis BED1]
MPSQSSLPQSSVTSLTCAPSSRYTLYNLSLSETEPPCQVYLRLLPVLKNRSSLPLSHGSSSNPAIAYLARPPSIQVLYSQPTAFRNYSHPHLARSTYSVTTHPGDSFPSGSALSHSMPTRVEKCTTRHLFSASDLDAITRNAEDILEFHEKLVQRLRQLVSPFGISMTPREIPAQNNGHSHHNLLIDVHHVINAVSTVFIDHASSFDQYQSFCSGHSEAFDIVRKVQHRYPTEWDAFELRCAALAAEMQSLDVAEDFIPSSESRRRLWDLCKRRHSLSSLDALSTENMLPLTTSESSHTDRETSSKRPRLMFMDYMIKPVQRVCRYPLLFDQLQERNGTQRFSEPKSTSTPMDGQDAVKTALRAMRTVASLVDEARRQQDLYATSVQIVSRITQGLLTSAASHNRPSQSASLPIFLSTLPPCHLSGSLDVIHYRGTNMARLGTVRAKYLGAFLFPGGFLVLVKVAKSKAYEPKHWFNLRAFELVDSNLDDVLLPSWFRLSSKAHMFEFAASCRREKDIWVDAVRRAIAEEVPWSDEPPSSLRVDFAASLLEFETISPLPTIQSIPELDDVESVVPIPGENPSVTQRDSQIRLRVESFATAPPVAGPSRRSSLGTHPAPVLESNTFHLVRSTASAREQVDRGLLDVFSEKCLTARFHAHTHEEDLFESQRVTRSFSRSSALTMASAMSVAAKNRLTKRESVLVPRKKSFVEWNGVSDTENCMASLFAAGPKPVKGRQHPSKLNIVTLTKATSQEGDEGGNEPALESPSPMSHCSSASVSFATPITPLTAPAPLPIPTGKADNIHPHSEFLNVRQTHWAPKRSKSMIENVRGLFAPRPASATTALSRESSTRSSVSNSSLLRWWSRESLRRRVRSAPDVPSEELPSALTTRSLHVEAATRSLLATTDRPYSQPDLHFLYSETVGPPTTEFGVDPPPQKKGIFSSRSSRRRTLASTLSSERCEDDSIPVPTRVRRNFLFLHRCTQSTRDYDTMPS